MSDSFQYDVFLSHSSKDKPAARELAGRLNADGLNVWLDEWVVKPGGSNSLAIQHGLESSRTLVLIMSEHSVGKTASSEWPILERQTALFRDPGNQERRFVPLRLDDVDINDSLKPFACVDWRERSSLEYARLRSVCKSRHRAQQEGVKPDDRETRKKCLIGLGYSSAISSDGRIAVFSGGAGIYQWDLAKEEGYIAVHAAGNVDRLYLSDSGSEGMYTSSSGHVATWRINSNAQSVRFELDSIVGCIRESPLESSLLVRGIEHRLELWSLRSRSLLHSITTKGAGPETTCVSAARDRSFIAMGRKDGTILVWDLTENRLRRLDTRHTGRITDLIVAPDGMTVISSSEDATIRITSAHGGNEIARLEGHTNAVRCLALAPDGSLLSSGADDCDVRLWTMQDGRCTNVSSAGAPIVTVAFINAGQQMAAICGDTTVIRWPVTREVCESTSFSRYTNAKVLLVGDSGAGKSGLAIRLTENKFEPTISSDAHWATQLKLPYESGAKQIDREIWLWDFAGQADYRLIHQLFMDETALAVLVFNPQSENPFEGLGQWDRDLVRAARRKFAKLLVAGRCDRGGLMVRRDNIAEFARQRGFAGYIETSAMTGDGCERLRDEIVHRIDWESIPWTASPRIFKLLKDEILRMRDEGVVLLRMGELKQQLQMRLASADRDPSADNSFTLEELRAVIGLLAGPGLVWRLEFGDIVMLHPEWINKYAAAVIRSVRAHIGEIGVIDEAHVLAGDLNYAMDIVRRRADGEDETSKMEMQRLDPPDEAIVLRAMHQMFVDHGLCVREELEGGGRQLIFPSYFKQELPNDPGHPPILVKYEFDGQPEEIYVTLIVQLWRTKAFENGALWRYAADFKSASGARLGLKMVRHADRKPEMSVYFDPDVQDDTKVTFIKYVHEHLLAKAQDVVRLRAFVCPHCGHPVRDAELARGVLEKHGKHAEIRCQDPTCDKRFPLWDIIEQKFASEEFQQRVRELEEQAKALIDNESRELILEGHARVITGEAGQIYRGYTGSDHGIDGEIEFKNDIGQASGKRLYLQLKSGDSYLYKRKSDGVEVFQIRKSRWADYWREQAYPVMLVIRTANEEIRWMNVTEYLNEKGKRRKTPVQQIEFRGETFTALNVQRMRDRLVPPFAV